MVHYFSSWCDKIPEKQLKGGWHYFGLQFEDAARSRGVEGIVAGA